MTDLNIGDVVKVSILRGKTKRGVDTVHTMYVTNQEAKCDGAVGTIIDIKEQGSHGRGAYLVDFTKNENKRMPPYIRYWFRSDFLVKQELAKTTA